MTHRAHHLFGNAQFREVGADLVEDRADLRCRRHQEELAGIGRALLQHGRGRIAAGVDLQRIERDPGTLDVVACLLGAGVDRRLRGRETVLRVQAVGQQNDDLVVGVVCILRRNREGRGGERLKAPLQADGLVGVAARRHRVDLGVERGPVVAQRHQLHGTVVILLGREQGRLRSGRRRRIGRVVVLIAIGDAAVPGAVIGAASAGGERRAVPVVEGPLVADAAGRTAAAAAVDEARTAHRPERAVVADAAGERRCRSRSRRPTGPSGYGSGYSCSCRY